MTAKSLSHGRITCLRTLGLSRAYNLKTVVNDRYAKKEAGEQVIRADQLIETIKRMNKASKESASLKDLKEMGERYLQMHIESQSPISKKFKQEELRTSLPPSGLHLRRRRENAVPKRGKPLVMREARRGTTYRRKILGLHRFLNVIL